METIAQKHINPERTAQTFLEIASRNYKAAHKAKLPEHVMRTMSLGVTLATNVMKEARSFGLTTSQVKRLSKMFDEDTELLFKSIGEKQCTKQ